MLYAKSLSIQDYKFLQEYPLLTFLRTLPGSQAYNLRVGLENIEDIVKSEELGKR